MLELDFPAFNKTLLAKNIDYPKLMTVYFWHFLQ